MKVGQGWSGSFFDELIDGFLLTRVRVHVGSGVFFIVMLDGIERKDAVIHDRVIIHLGDDELNGRLGRSSGRRSDLVDGQLEKLIEEMIEFIDLFVEAGRPGGHGFLQGVKVGEVA